MLPRQRFGNIDLRQTEETFIGSKCLTFPSRCNYNLLRLKPAEWRAAKWLASATAAEQAVRHLATGAKQRAGAFRFSFYCAVGCHLLGAGTKAADSQHTTPWSIGESQLPSRERLCSSRYVRSNPGELTMLAYILGTNHD